jgi:dipeptidyl aminopeptidase/acylaminoacyl peptidase
MVDNNVEFADTIRLVERLIELRKENWQLAVFPVESHGFVKPASWADEYKRILGLFEKNLK